MLPLRLGKDSAEQFILFKSNGIRLQKV